MTLQEILRTRTWEALEVLQSYESELRKLGLQKDAELRQLESLQIQIDSKRTDEERSRKRFDEISISIRDMERQLHDLRHERDELATALERLDDEAAAVGNQRKRAKGKSDDLEHQLRELVTEKERAYDRLRSGRRVALLDYLEDLELRLARQIAVQQEISQKLASRERLEQARHAQADVMQLHEARVELQKLLKMSNVVSIRDHLGSQLRAVESQLEALFPGALAVEGQSGMDSQVEELHFAVDTDGSLQIFLPISVRTWETLAGGDFGQGASSVLRLVWALGRALVAAGINPRVNTQGEFILMTVDERHATDVNSVDVTMPLPGSGAVTFLLTKLPHEVQEAVRYEDSTK